MGKFFIFIALIIFGRNASACSNYDDADCQAIDALQGNYFSNLWQVHVDGNDNVAQRIAQDLGFQLVGPIPGFKHHYYFKNPQVADKHKRKHNDFSAKLKAHKNVHSADQQFVWLSTINDFYNYKDMVSHSDPLEIVSYPLNPEEVDFEEKTPVTLGFLQN